MPTVKNMSYGYLTLELPDRSVTLGPRESVNVLDSELNTDDVKQKFREDLIFVISGEAATPPQAADSADNKPKTDK